MKKPLIRHTMEIWFRPERDERLMTLVFRNTYSYTWCQAADQHVVRDTPLGQVHILCFGASFPHDVLDRQLAEWLAGNTRIIDLRVFGMRKGAKNGRS